MTIREYYGVSGTLQGSISAATAVLPVSSALSGAIAATFVNGVDSTYFSLRTGNFYELVKVTNVAGNNLTVLRGQLGTVAQVFPIGTELKYEVTSAALLALVGVIPNTVNIQGTGLAQVSSPVLNTFDINVPAPVFLGDDRISVLGTYPNLQFTYTQEQNDCCDTETGATGQAITNVVGEGLVVAFVNGEDAIVRVTPPVFTSGANISVTGAWPNYTISATAGSGTVASVNAGAGLSLTGSPTVNPTLLIANTGVIAGTYGGVGINVRGQITVVPPTFNPVSIVVAGAGLGYARVGDQVTLTPVVGNIGVKGIVEFADHTDPFNPLDASTAATPAVVALALNSLVTASVAGVNSYTGESDASYTNTISGSTVPLVLASGEKALISAEVVMVDGTTPLTPVSFGIAVFSNAPAKLKSNRTINQSLQNMQFVLDGPFSGSVTILTTAIPGGSTITTYSLNVVTF